MAERCARCDAETPRVDGVAPGFCGNCGLPQLRVPEEFFDGEGSEAALTEVAQPAGALDWPLAMRIAAAAALLGLIPCALLPGALLYGMAGIFALLLLPLFTLGCGAVYQRRRRGRDFTVGMGARLGVALAVLLGTLVMLATGIAGFAVRYGAHSRALEQALELAIGQAVIRVQSGGSPMPANWMAVMGWAEVRSGFFVGLVVFQAVLLVIAGALSGALAGAVLHARWRRTQGE